MTATELVEPRRLRRVVLVVAGLNLAYFLVEVAVALAIGSVSLLADSVDFLEDTSVNLLIALALGWPLPRRALVGHVWPASSWCRRWSRPGRRWSRRSTRSPPT